MKEKGRLTDCWKVSLNSPSHLLCSLVPQRGKAKNVVTKISTVWFPKLRDDCNLTCTQNISFSAAYFIIRQGHTPQQNKNLNLTNTTAGKTNSKQDAIQYSSMRRLP